MNNAATFINNMLQDSAELQAVINGAHYWELADEGVIEPFITFSLAENRAATKSGLAEYEVKISIWAESLTKAGDIYPLVKEAARVKNILFRGAATGYTDGEAQTAFLRIDFNFKLRN